MRRMAWTSLRAMAWPSWIFSLAICSRVGGARRGSSASGELGPTGNPCATRLPSAACVAFFCSQRRSQGCFSKNARQMPALGRTVQSPSLKVPRLKEAMTVSPMSEMRTVIVGTAKRDQTMKKGFPALLVGDKSP